MLLQWSPYRERETTLAAQGDAQSDALCARETGKGQGYLRMTPNLSFESLLVSQDVQVLRSMSRIMEDLSIQVDVCMLSSRARDLLGKRDIDLLVVDWDTKGGPDLVKTKSRTAGREMTIVAVVNQVIAGDLALQAGAHTVIYTPFTTKSNAEFRSHVYFRMVTERRRRHGDVITSLVAAADLDGNPVPVTMTI